jgi:hypothetical protein
MPRSVQFTLLLTIMGWVGGIGAQEVEMRIMPPVLPASPSQYPSETAVLDQTGPSEGREERGGLRGRCAVLRLRRLDWPGGEEQQACDVLYQGA